MLIVVLWIGASVLVAWAGRQRRGGFWGMLLFSLVCTPLVALFAMLLAGGPVEPESVEGRSVSLRAEAAHAEATLPGGMRRRVIWTRFIMSWTVMVLGFTVVFNTLAGTRNWYSLLLYLQVSLSAATLRLAPVSLGDEVLRGRIEVLRAIEVFLAIVLVVWTIARLVASSRAIDRLLSRGASAGPPAEYVARLEAMLREQEQEVARLKSQVAASTDAQRSPAPAG